MSQIEVWIKMQLSFCTLAIYSTLLYLYGRKKSCNPRLCPIFSDQRHDLAKDIRPKTKKMKLEKQQIIIPVRNKMANKKPKFTSNMIDGL